jgi:hypothetical protein
LVKIKIRRSDPAKSQGKNMKKQKKQKKFTGPNRHWKTVLNPRHKKMSLGDFKRSLRAIPRALFKQKEK